MLVQVGAQEEAARALAAREAQLAEELAAAKAHAREVRKAFFIEAVVFLGVFIESVAFLRRFYRVSGVFMHYYRVSGV